MTKIKENSIATYFCNIKHLNIAVYEHISCPHKNTIFASIKNALFLFLNKTRKTGMLVCYSSHCYCFGISVDLGVGVTQLQGVIRSNCDCQVFGNKKAVVKLVIQTVYSNGSMSFNHTLPLPNLGLDHCCYSHNTQVCGVHYHALATYCHTACLISWICNILCKGIVPSTNNMQAAMTK